MSKIALITGVTGQDGSILSELLLDKGYKVYGLNRRTSTPNTSRLSLSLQNKNFELVEGDVSDQNSVQNIINAIKPTELYNLAAQSHVKTSFDQPNYTFQVNATGVLNCLEAIRLCSSETRFYQASTSEMFGSNISLIYDIQGQSARYDGAPLKKGDSIYENRYGFDATSPEYDGDGIFQDENTPFAPNSPYAVAKLAAHNLVRNYRDSYGLHASAGILFNHESPRRGAEFVTKKITNWITEFRAWRKKTHMYMDAGDDIQSREGDLFPKLRLGNLDAKRDWGHARDYVEGMWAMLQQDKPDDYVLATGETHSIREFLAEAFGCVGITDWEDYVVCDPKYYRPLEVSYLLGDYSKARKVLGWEPKTKFKELVKEMINS